MEILSDFRTSVIKSLEEIDENWSAYKGLVVCGSHKPDQQQIDIILKAIQEFREAGKPFLGICFGHQLAFVEYCRNVLKIKDATSEEWGEGTFVVKKREKGLNVGYFEGESYWNNYEIDPILAKKWKKADNFITVQYHPEYQSSIDKPHPILKKLLDNAKEYTMAV